MPDELELLDEDEEELLLELFELELLELELEFELELLELDELELPVPGLPLELLPPHATKAVAKTRDTLALVNPKQLTDGKQRFIKHIPALCDLPLETITAAKFSHGHPFLRCAVKIP